MESLKLDNAGKRWVLVACILGSSMIFIDYAAINVALPAIQNSFHISGQALIWIINAYALFLSAFMLIGGAIGDIYGRKKVFVIGVIVFTISSLVCGFAPNEKILIIGRAFQGLGGSIMVPGSVSLIAALFNKEEQGKAFGLWSMFSAITTISGPVIGGWLAGEGLWRFIFFINIPLSIITVLILLFRIPESYNKERKSPDFSGALLVTAGLGGISYCIIEYPRYYEFDIYMLIALIFGLLGFSGFLYIEQKSRNPMIPLSLFKSRNFSVSNIFTIFIYGAISAFLFFYPLNLIQIQNYSEKMAGLSILPFVIIIAALSAIVGKWTNYFGSKKILTAGAILTGAGFFLLAIPGKTTGPSSYFLTYFPGIFVLGTGMGLIAAPLTTAVMASVTNKESGTASGINNTISRVAGLIAIAFYGALAFVFFKSKIIELCAELDVNKTICNKLINQAQDFAAAKPPENIASPLKNKIVQRLDSAFIETFRFLCYLSGILSIIAAIFSGLLMKSPKKNV